MNYKNTSKEDLIRENENLRFRLNEVEEKYKLFADNVSDVIWIFDFNEDRFHYISPSIRYLLGYSLEEAILLKWEDIVIPEEQEKFRHFVTEILSKIKRRKNDRDEAFKLEVNQYHKNGSTVGVELKASFLFNNKGKPFLILGVSRDITDRRIAEDKLRKAYANLEKMVEQRTAHLYEANIALKVILEKRDKDKSELEEKVGLNLRDLVLPNLEKLKKLCPKKQQQAYLNILEENIKDIISPLIRSLSMKYLKFSPNEIQVINLISKGKSNKEISELMNISLRTVEFHRRNIRQKLGIKNKKINLRTCISSIQ
jgi:PAS domain S-box-containing protein